MTELNVSHAHSTVSPGPFAASLQVKCWTWAQMAEVYAKFSHVVEQTETRRFQKSENELNRVKYNMNVLPHESIPVCNSDLLYKPKEYKIAVAFPMWGAYTLPIGPVWVRKAGATTKSLNIKQKRNAKIDFLNVSSNHTADSNSASSHEGI